MERPEFIKRLPKWAQTILVVAAITAPVAGAVATIVKTVYEVKAAKSKAKEANVKSGDTYETLAPAVMELQDIVNVRQDWSDGIDRAVDNLEYYDGEIDNRLVRLETYIEILSRRGNLPDIPDPEPERGPASVMSDPMAAILHGLPSSSSPESEAPKAKRPVPETLQKAQSYQKERTKMHCPPDDPLCALPE